MKKNFMMLIVCSFLLIFMTGCEKTYLSCSKVLSDTEDLKINETIKLGYKRKKLVNSNVYYDYKIKNTDIDKISFKEGLELECKEYEDNDGVDCKVSELNGGIHFELNLEVDELDSSSLELFDEMLSHGSYMDAKNNLSKEYTCK